LKCAQEISNETQIADAVDPGVSDIFKGRDKCNDVRIGSTEIVRPEIDKCPVDIGKAGQVKVAPEFGM